MIAVWLTMVICAGATCEVVELEARVTPRGCDMAGWALATAWVAEHEPGHEVRDWRCWRAGAAGSVVGSHG